MILAFIFLTFFAYLVMVWAHHWLAKKGQVLENYRARLVVFPLGLFLPLPVLLAYCFLDIRGLMPTRTIALSFFFQCTVFLMGLFDDFWGKDEAKGFYGHFTLLRRGKVSTGILKVLGCTFASFLFIIGMGVRKPILILLYFFTFLLGINGFNLLDKRPGRCLKGLAIFSSPLWICFNYQARILFSLVLATGTFDLKEKGMLGDTGANYLGSIFVSSLFFANNLALTIFFFLLFFSLNIIGEFSSLSQVIKKNYFLEKLDLWGR